MKVKKICFDIDGVICNLSKNNDYLKSKPIRKNINLINLLYKKNYNIILFTSRFMGRNKDDSIKAYKMGFQFTKNQLKKWGVKYHKLIMGKPSYDLMVDDKSIFFKKDWNKLLHKKLN